jgi:putative DNA primase/helicase
MMFQDFAAAHGLIIDRIEVGRWVRTKTTDHPMKRNGSYFHGGEYWVVQNWATMPEAVVGYLDKPMTPGDQSAMQKRIEAGMRKHAKERQEARQQAARKAAHIIRQARPEKHAYLDSKGFPDAVGLVYRTDESTNLLVIPMRVGKELVGCQLIDADGHKKFLYGQRCAGAEFVIGSGRNDWYCEGYSTGLSLMAALNALKASSSIHVCFSAGNMETIAKAAGRGFVCADHDLSGTGQNAAEATGLRYFMPPEIGTDMNDLHRKVGTFKSSQELRKFLQQ